MLLLDQSLDSVHDGLFVHVPELSPRLVWLRAPAKYGAAAGP
jgi:hypothetical protein